MSDLDLMLGQLRDLPVDPRLGAIEADVLAGVARRRERVLARRGLVLAGVLAMGVGWAGSVAPGAPARAASAVPVIGLSDYAPSRLLGE